MVGGADLSIGNDPLEVTVRLMQTEQEGDLQGRCCFCLEENQRPCMTSLAIVALIGGGLIIYEGIRCSIETEASSFGLDARCVVFSGAGCIPFGYGAAKIGKILCSVLRN